MNTRDFPPLLKNLPNKFLECTRSLCNEGMTKISPMVNLHQNTFLRPQGYIFSFLSDWCFWLYYCSKLLVIHHPCLCEAILPWILIEGSPVNSRRWIPLARKTPCRPNVTSNWSNGLSAEPNSKSRLCIDVDWGRQVGLQKLNHSGAEGSFGRFSWRFHWQACDVNYDHWDPGLKEQNREY